MHHTRNWRDYSLISLAIPTSILALIQVWSWVAEPSKPQLRASIDLNDFYAPPLTTDASEVKSDAGSLLNDSQSDAQRTLESFKQTIGLTVVNNGQFPIKNLRMVVSGNGRARVTTADASTRVADFSNEVLLGDLPVAGGIDARIWLNWRLSTFDETVTLAHDNGRHDVAAGPSLFADTVNKTLWSLGIVFLAMLIYVHVVSAAESLLDSVRRSADDVAQAS